MERNLLVNYKDTIGDIIKAKEKYKTGKGIFFYFSPQELIKRLELLGGSLAAGNNGVYTVFTNGGHAGKNWCLVMKARRWRINKNCK